MHAPFLEHFVDFSGLTATPHVPHCLRFRSTLQHLQYCNIATPQETVAGLNVPKIAKTVERLVAECGVVPEQAPAAEDLNARLTRLTKMAKCVAFIKGTPQVRWVGPARLVYHLLPDRLLHTHPPRPSFPHTLSQTIFSLHPLPGTTLQVHTSTDGALLIL